MGLNGECTSLLSQRFVCISVSSVAYLFSIQILGIQERTKYGCPTRDAKRRRDGKERECQADQEDGGAICSEIRIPSHESSGESANTVFGYCCAFEFLYGYFRRSFGWCSAGIPAKLNRSC